MDTTKIKYIKSLKGKISDTEIRKKIQQVGGYKKTAANEWFNKIFNDKKVKSVSPKKEKFGPDENIMDWGYDGEDEKVVESNNPIIRTLEDLIEVCKIDTNIWECIRFTGNSYGENFQAKGEFKRKVTSDVEQIISDLKEDLINYSPDVEEIDRVNVDTGIMLEVCAFDLHLGKLGWKQSDGQDYDIQEAKTRFKNSISELIESSKNYKIDQILFPIGNDYLTIDNDKNTTTALTPQSVDSRFPKIFKEGRELLVWAIDKLKQIAPVNVLVVAGNHETNSMHHIGDSLECWYRNDKNVAIDNSPAPRKYAVYGKVLIGFDHGDKIKLAKLPMTMASECEAWSNCKHREIHVGHLHHEKVVATETDSCIVRIIPALSGNDNYHNTHGYIGSKQRAQAFVWDSESGLKTIFYSNSYN